VSAWKQQALPKSRVVTKQLLDCLSLLTVLKLTLVNKTARSLKSSNVAERFYKTFNLFAHRNVQLTVQRLNFATLANHCADIEAAMLKHTSMAFVSILVNRNGIFSGNFSRAIAT